LLSLPALALFVGGAASAGQPAPLTVRSTAFAAGGAIPAQYSCESAGALPPLQWSGVPDGTRSIAVVIDDPDAPRGDFVHFVAYNLPPDARVLPAAGVLGSSAGQVGALGVNSSGQAGYAPICPPSGQHHYRFRVLALDARLDLQQPTAAALERASRGHVLARGELTGTYRK
jgi:Raf kinase inhibitor-like YbhB/YbcL family protein